MLASTNEAIKAFFEDTLCKSTKKVTADELLCWVFNELPLTGIRTSERGWVNADILVENEKSFQNPLRRPLGEQMVTVEAGYAAAASGGLVRGPYGCS